MNAYIIKRRDFDGLSRWKSDRYGYQTRKRWMPWKSVERFNLLDDARKKMRKLAGRGGLSKWAIFHNGERIEDCF
jgi:hypothetical protein